MTREQIRVITEIVRELAAEAVADTDVATHSGYYGGDDGRTTLRNAAENVMAIDPDIEYIERRALAVQIVPICDKI